jgi:hypothetical protein
MSRLQTDRAATLGNWLEDLLALEVPTRIETG